MGNRSRDRRPALVATRQPRRRWWAFAALLAASATVGCAETDAFCGSGGCFFTAEEWARLEGLAGLAAPPPDPSNRFVGNPAAVALGHELYFDTELSGAASWVDMLDRPTSSARAPRDMPARISCATCHDPAHAGADKTSVPGHVSVGAGWYDVNGQQSVNAAYYQLLYWNGRADSLWAQAAAVMESSVSMNGNRVAIARAVLGKHRARYDALVGTPTTFDASVTSCSGAAPDCGAGCDVITSTRTGAQACQPSIPLAGRPGRIAGCQHDDPGEPFRDAFDCMDPRRAAVVTNVFINVAKLIGAYEYELRSRNAPFDRFVAEGPLSSEISPAAKRGARLFVGRASCVDCHATPLLSDNRFHNIGVPQVGDRVPTEADCRKGNVVCDCERGLRCLPWGFYDGRMKLLESRSYRRDGEFSDDPEKGGELYSTLYNLPASDATKGAWRTPSLRDVERTAPYMHNGLYRTLEEVVWHYDQGGGTGTASGKKAPELKPLFLSQQDRADLVQFLLTLTGTYDRPELHEAPAGAVP
ncbi:MAG TPA: cytochrome c peroxidase [Polyangia bacterium]